MDEDERIAQQDERSLVRRLDRGVTELQMWVNRQWNLLSDDKPLLETAG